KEDEIPGIERVDVTHFIVPVDWRLIRAHRHDQPGMQRVEQVIRQRPDLFPLHRQVEPVSLRLLSLEQRSGEFLLDPGKHILCGCHFTPPISQNTSPTESAQPNACHSRYI